jgi:hypothetical protein
MSEKPLTARNRKAAEERIFDSITVRCKECRRLMPRCMQHYDKSHLFYCNYCERWGGATQ